MLGELFVWLGVAGATAVAWALYASGKPVGQDEKLDRLDVHQHEPEAGVGPEDGGGS